MKTATDPFAPLVGEDTPTVVSERTRNAFLPGDVELPHITGVVTARFEGFDVEDRPLVTGLPGLHHQLVPARSTTGLTRDDVGATVVAACEGGDARKPIILGVLREHARDADAHKDAKGRQPLSVDVDNDQIVLKAERQIVLRCGDASITLTRAGKILIAGRYLLSRSSGYNRIKGAAVDIN